MPSLQLLIDQLQSARNEIELARYQSQHPKDLDRRIKNAAVQVSRIVVALHDEDFASAILPSGIAVIQWVIDALRKPNSSTRLPISVTIGKQQLTCSKVRLGSGCDVDGRLRDDTALAFWVQVLCPIIRASSPLLKGKAGSHDIPSYNVNKHGKLVGRDGQVLEYETTEDGSTELIGEPVSNIETLDPSSALAYFNSRAADWLDACTILDDQIKSTIAISRSEYEKRSRMILNLLEDEYAELGSLILPINELESFRRICVDQPEPSPGIKIKWCKTDDTCHLWLRQPTIEDVRDGYFNLETVDEHERSEIKSHLMRTINNWRTELGILPPQITASEKDKPDFETCAIDTLDNLTGLNFKLFRYLKAFSHFKYYDTLRQEVWEKEISDSGITQGLKRLKKALSKFDPILFDVEIRSTEGRAKLQFISGDKQRDTTVT